MKRFMAKAEFNNYKVISFTSKGKELADRLLSLISDGNFVRECEESEIGKRERYKESSYRENVVVKGTDDGFTLDGFVKENFYQGNVLIFIGAAGIAVRAIAPYIEDKTKDPAVIVMDEAGKNVIPLLSGHIGGGVREAEKIANLIGANCVMTTASDVSGEFAVDVFASENGFVISDMKKAKEFTARLLEEKVAVYEVDAEIAGMPPFDVDTGFANVIRQSAGGESFEKENDFARSKASFTISFHKNKSESGVLSLIPKCIAIGVGCKKGTPYEKLRAFVEDKLSEHNLDKRAVKVLASADIKKDEEGLILLAKELGAEFKTFSSEVLMAQEGEFTASSFVKSITGTDNVCERAVAACGCKKMLVIKESFDGMTFAAGVLSGKDAGEGMDKAEDVVGLKYLDVEKSRNCSEEASDTNCAGMASAESGDLEKRKGKVSVVGIGPGNYENMTVKAVRTLEECDVIAGYTVYCDLVRPFFPDKEYISTPMMGEEKRVKLAYNKAAEGKKVALVCSGDAGVYGMAGLCYEEAVNFDNVDTEVVPGVTAAISGAALLGAPLIHDFCLISMSDRLTPMELIEKRLRAAASADMVVVIYNPESKGRKGYLAHACEILMENLPPERVCGIAGNIGRDGEYCKVMTLGELKGAEVDMFSTIFIGNSSTRDIAEHMVTLRGYRSER
ncbi:MAG: precorrin-3B C(17)-methyltransferase [Butyrivibrio sp.]|nr:precorrin-3B C(17)-methyltransferase [Butyrivibrio sp.]